MHVPTPSAVAPATTPTRPSTWRTTVSSTRTRSLSFMRPISLVTPSAVSPLTPAPMKRSMTRLRLSRSRSPAAVKGVGRTEYTPSSFTVSSRGRFASTLLLYPVLYPGDKHEVHSPAGAGRGCRLRPARRNPRGRRLHPAALQVHLCLLRIRRAELHVHERRQETDRRATGAQPRSGGDSRPSFAGHRRRYPGAQVGIHQRLHRRCQWQARLRLDHRRPHLRYLHPGEGAALRRD